MIALACDHGALELKEAIKKHLEELGLAYRDFGIKACLPTNTDSRLM